MCDYHGADVTWKVGLGKWDMLKAQFLNEGGVMQKLDIHEFSPNNRGLMAVEDIEDGDLLMFIPDHYLLKEDLARQNKIVQTLEEKDIETIMQLFPHTVYLLE